MRYIIRITNSRNLFRILVVAIVVSLASLASAQTWINFTQENGDLISNDVHTICVDGFDYIWIGSDMGLSRFNGKIWSHFQKSDITEYTLSSNHINDLVYDLGNLGYTLWIATGEGISLAGLTNSEVAFSKPILSSDTNVKLPSNEITAVGVDSRHITWFGTHNGISCLSSEGWEMYLAADFFEIYNDNVQDVAVGNDTVYFATMGGGVTRLRYDVDAITTASPVNTWNFIASDTVYSVFVDSKSVKWFGTNHGVSRLQGSDQRIFPNWITYTTDSVYASVVHKGIPDDTVYVIQGDGLADNTVQAICEDSDGNMWFGTPTGVTRFDGNTWKTFTIKDGLASNDVRDIAVSSKGEVWCATKSGVSKFVKEPAKVILAQTQIPHFLAVSSYPNPFNMETNIKIILPQSEFVRVDIYDILGKKIKTLVQNQLSAGPNLLKWDGKNDRGVSVTSGVYIVQLVSKTCVSTTKIVVAK